MSNAGMMMNERIRELAIEAGIIIDFNDPLYGQLSEGTKQKQLVITKKFAELIVRECADLCESFGESGDGYTCSAEIQEHFGVKE